MIDYKITQAEWDLKRVAADIQFRAIPGFRDEVIDATNAAARAAHAYAYQFAPVGTTGLYSTANPQHVGGGSIRRALYITPAKYRPGGAGGGGTWVAEVGVDTDIAPHAVYVLEGTGIYGPHKRNIYAKGQSASEKYGGGHKKSRMVFQKLGEPIRYVRKIKGQPPKWEWWFGAMEEARFELRRRLSGS